MAEQVDLYQRVPNLGETIPVLVDPFAVENSIPEEVDIEWDVKRIRSNRSGGPLGIWSEHLRQWLAEARDADTETDTETETDTDTDMETDMET